MKAVIYIPEELDPSSGPIRQFMMGEESSIQKTANTMGGLYVEVQIKRKDYDKDFHVVNGEVVEKTDG